MHPNPKSMPTPPDGLHRKDHNKPSREHPQHEALRKDLGVPPGAAIPQDRMQQALAGVHGNDVQKRAKAVEAGPDTDEGPGMNEIFAPGKRIAKDNAQKPQVPSPGKPAGRSRFSLEGE